MPRWPYMSDAEYVEKYKAKCKQLIATFNDVPVDGLILSGLNYLGLSEGKTPAQEVMK